MQKEARAIGYRVYAQVEDCVELGLPQKRRRQLFIGTRLDLPDYFHSEIKPAPRACDHPPLWEAIFPKFSEKQQNFGEMLCNNLQATLAIC